MKKNLRLRQIVPIILTVFLGHFTSIAQTLEEIPAPAGSSYGEGTKINETNALISFTDLTFNSNFNRFDGETMGPSFNFLPVTDVFHINSYGDSDYFISFSDATTLLSYDHTTTIGNSIQIPNNHFFPEFVSDYNDELFYYAFDQGAGERFLYKLDQGGLTNIITPNDFNIGGFFGKTSGKMFFNFLNPQFTEDFLFSYDGTNFEQISPNAETKFFPIIADINSDTPYLIFQNTTTEIFSLYNYDGNDLTAIPNPPSTNLSRVIGRFGDIVFLDFLNTASGEFEFYAYDGSDYTLFTDVEPGYQISEYIETYGDYSYFSFTNLASGDTQVYRYEGSTNALSLISLIDGDNLSFSGTALGTLGNKLYLNYLDSNFEGNVVALEFGSTIATPLVLDGNNKYVDFLINNTNTHLYWAYIDPTSFTNTLFVFDGTELIEIPNPTGLLLSEFQFEFDGSNDFFLTYVNADLFQNVLYKIKGEELFLVENNIASTVSLYPNPASNYVQIEFENKAINDLDLKLYSMSGQFVVYEKSYSNIESVININTNNLPSGIYVLHGKTNLGHFQKKIVIE